MSDLKSDFAEMQRDLSKALAYDIPREVGIEGEDYFKQSFIDEKFDTVPWQEVKRRMPTSKWNGFRYAGKGRKGKKKHFSPAAVKSKILTGASGDLGASVSHRVAPGKVIFSSDKPYAQVHNEGLHAKIFGKAKFKMKKRQFMGYSRELEIEIDKIVDRRIKKVFDKR